MQNSLESNLHHSEFQVWDEERQSNNLLKKGKIVCTKFNEVRVNDSCALKRTRKNRAHNFTNIPHYC